MKKAPSKSDKWEMRPEYDFSGGIRGKWAARYAEGTNVVLLEPDVAAVFPDSKAVNEILRLLVSIARRKTKRSLSHASRERKTG
jgi:hypothetical protein